MIESKIKETLTELKEKEIRLREEVKKQTVGYVLTALSLVGGLAWNQAIQALVTQFFPSKNGGVLASFIYAIVITIIVVIITIYLLRFKKEKN